MSNSDKVKQGLLRAPHRSLLYALGLEKEDMDKPFIGIANSFNETVPGHKHLRSLVESIKEGIYKSGGIPFEFNTIAACDGLAMNHEGMSYSFVSRNLICDSIILQAKAFPFDGMVFVPNCDKVVPGMLMAAAKLDLPSVFISGGPMLSVNVEKKNLTLTSVFEAVGAYQNKEIDEKQLEVIEQEACPTCGSCSGMYTANTMNCLCEVLGIALPGNGTIPAVYSKRTRLAKHAGQTIMQLVKQNLTFNQIVTKESFENAIVADMAMSGSTNTILHLMAIAKSANHDLRLKDFDIKSSSTPQLVKLSPASNYVIQDFDQAGGMMALLKELGSKYIKPAKTIISANILEQVKYYENNNTDIIHTLNNPYEMSGGLAILKGNLALDGAVVKTGAVSENMKKFSGKARVFEDEESCVEYLKNYENDFENKVLVIRNVGVKSGKGIPEMLTPTSLIKGKGLGQQIALVTDGRFSGGSNGLVIGHVCPEANENGLIAYVKNDDVIEIDLINNTLHLDVSEAELKLRDSQACKYHSNDYLERYSDQANNASKGGGL